MNTQLYFITANTHLHVGSGNSNAGVIDNLVQRDPSDNLPCIYASSLKGAFREYFEEGPDKENTENFADQIFGAGANKQSSGDSSKGTHIFHQANLLSIPARSNMKPFFNATCPMVIEKIKEEVDLFGISLSNDLKEELRLIFMGKNLNDKCDVFSTEIPGLKIEDYQRFNFRGINIPILKKIFGDNLVMMTNENFMDLCNDYNLPVIARNNLENGQSKNLWYEQIVPRQARFWFFTAFTCNDDNFDTTINKKNVQIGANASIGYGLCSIKNFKTHIL